MNLFYRMFPAFRNRNFRLYTWSQGFSFFGTWFQDTAQAILIFQLTHSVVLTATVSATKMIPGLLSPLGGVIVDRFGSRRITYHTQIWSMVPAFIIGIIVYSGGIKPWELIVGSFVVGIVNALDSPARQAIIGDSVPKTEIRSAISINTALVHGTQFIGPLLAGLLIPWIGFGAAFFLNGLSFIGVIVAVAMMRMEPHPSHNGLGVIEMTKRGIQYVLNDPSLSFLMTLYFLAGMLGYAFRGIIPPIAQVFFAPGNTNELSRLVGALSAAISCGAGIGAIVASAFHRASPRIFIITGAFAMGLALFGFSLWHDFWTGCLLLAIVGFGFTLCTSTIRSTAWRFIDATMQGRVMGILIMTFLLGMGIGSYAIGVLGERLGIQRTILLNGFFLIGSCFFAVLSRKKIPAA